MAQEHVVEQGECFSSIAKEYGFLEKTLWNHPANAELKAKRKNPNVLLPNDVVTIPDKNSGEEEASTEQKHVYKVKDERVKFNLQILINDRPIANENYVLVVNGEFIEGSTDGNGWIRVNIKANAKSGKLSLYKLRLTKTLNFGCLNPSDTDSGALARLKNLGYYIGEINDVDEEKLRAIIKGFQKDNDLFESGELDSETQSKLKELHYC